MIKRVSLVTRKAGMPVEEFQRYWREVHAPLALRVPGLRRYIQSHVLLETYDVPNPPAFDGIVETWWDSVQASEEARKTPERTAVDADQPNFMGGSKGLITTEIPFIDAFPNGKDRESMVKYISALHRRESVSVEAFQKHWRDVHGPAVVAVAGARGMRRYVQTHVLPETYGGGSPPAYDGLAEIWYDGLAAYENNRPGATGGSLDPKWGDVCRGQERILTREISFLD